ncbi:hypothetical protein CAPTEDRAFT_190988 [Capitella teleta]|uniref:Coiled-coil domain-containing protein 112 n=1 Tax=Capitella teleta TaxID=283909 RepID=R7TK18_CAPTE|nr:hypothetical protein CAPTEDRAFT_190988 [Capitella teleta]|eukprot:ELT93807.1 hypothetical protein CAPTEDRAFT_190988 [Capitella teleta]
MAARSEKTQKAELIKELHRMKLNIDKLEREKSNQIYNKHSELYQEFATLQEIDRKFEQDRRTSGRNTEQTLVKIKSQVAKFRREVKEVKPTPEFVEKIKVLMEDIEVQINSFKDAQRLQYEELLRDEHIVNLEVTALEKRIDVWASMKPGSAHNTRSQHPTKLPSHRDVHRFLPPEVTAFERFEAQTGGQRGGWDEYDHAMFLKYRNRSKNKNVFIEELASVIPTKDGDEIRHHEMWFREYEMLRQRKKEAIAEWRQHKEIEREEPESSDEEDKEQQRQMEELKQRRLAEERALAKAELNKWKVEKELKRAEEEQRILREQLRQKDKEEMERKRQEEVKARVEEFKEIKSAEERERRLVEELRRRVEMEEKQKVAKVIVGKLKDRDLEKVYTKRNVRLEAERKAELDKQKRLNRLRNQVAVEAPRDPSRLLRPTAGWVERQKDTDSTPSGRILHAPKKAIPTWRQNIH